MTSKSDTIEKQPRVGLGPTDSILVPSTSGADPQCAGNKAHIIITSIRATDVLLGLRRFSAGFHIIVRHSGIEWRTENKPASVNHDVEWNESLPMPSDSSATVCLEVYASFEFQPMLGTGELLQRLTVTVGQVFDHSERHIPFTFFPKDGDVVSPCSSITVTTERSDPSASRTLSLFCSTTDAAHELEDATNHGHSALSRYRKHGEKRDLEHSVVEFERALNACPLNHPCRAAVQSNLAMAEFILCQVNGTNASFQIPLELWHNALATRPVGHADRPSTLIQLAAVYLVRFEKQRNEGDRARVEALLHEVIGFRSADHESRGVAFMLEMCAGDSAGPDHAGGQLSVDSGSESRLTDGDPGIVSFWLVKRFERYGDLADLDRAIALLRTLIGTRDERYSAGLGNLAGALLLRFKRFGEVKDLEGAISTLREAVRLAPDGHPGKPHRLNNLGLCFRARYERLGELRDLEDAISTHRDAVRFTPDGHPNKLRRLNNLGLSFRARYERLGELRDLEDAISTHRDAVCFTPDGHPDKPRRLNNLGVSLITRFSRVREMRDLEEAILTYRDAVRLIPHGHPDKPAHLTNLGNSFVARFSCLGELGDLESAISIHRDAVHLTPNGHPDKPRHLNSLGVSFMTRFERLGELRDLEDAISTYGDTAHLTPHGHPRKSVYLNHLGFSFITRFERLGELRDFENAITLYSHSASFPIGPIHIRVEASRNWIRCARRIHHPSLLRAYSIAINLLPQLAWIGLSLAHRYAELRQGVDLVREAAAAALDSGFPELAVEWLEQGRSIVWGELLQLRASYEELSSAHPDHARRLSELFAALDDAGAAREKPLSTLLASNDDPMNHATQTLEQEADRHRRFAIERDELLKDIRRLPGFRRFLLPNDFSHLRASAHSGPVVILNAAQPRCDALVILPSVDHAIHVPLPNFNFRRSVALQNMLGKLLGHARAIPFDDRKGHRAILPGFNWESLLSTLWDRVVKPVLDALVFSTPEELSRIFWCPTGPFVFLPIHAAGLYGIQHSSRGHKVSDFVVSSYVPTLSILARSPNPTVPPTSALRLLTVPQPSSDGQNPLRGVAPELRYINTIVENSPASHTTLSQSSVGTVEEVLGLMKDADWVHFACHGVQDDEKPTDSGLCLADGRRLKISDIIGLSRTRGGLAFLSACQTAMGDEELSDEAIHIAAGMLFAGYGGVIGTMWSISDRLAPVVARDFYEYLFRNGTRPDHREAARALHEAIGRAREEEPFETWLPFIHVGL